MGWVNRFSSMRHLIFTFLGILSFAVSATAEENSKPKKETVETSKKWISQINLGATLAKGNTDSIMITSEIKTEKKDIDDDYLLRFSYAYGEENRKASTDETLALATWKHTFKGENFYSIRFDGRRDTFADIRYRASLTGSYGYNVIKTELKMLSLDLGLGVTVEEKDQVSDVYPHALFAEHFEQKLSNDTKVYQNFSFFPRLNTIHDFRIVFEAGLETALTETISFRVSLVDKYENTPAEDKEPNDLKVVTGLTYKF